MEPGGVVARKAVGIQFLFKLSVKILIVRIIRKRNSNDRRGVIGCGALDYDTRPVRGLSAKSAMVLAGFGYGHLVDRI